MSSSFSVILLKAVLLKGTYHWKELGLGLEHPRVQPEEHQNHLMLNLVQNLVQLESLGLEGRDDLVKKLQNLAVKEQQQMQH